MRKYTFRAAAAVIAVMAASLGFAPAAGAALSDLHLPAGCSTFEGWASNNAQLGTMQCTSLANNADFSQFESLYSLTIGSRWTPDRKLTKLPVLPPTLETLEIHSANIKDFSNLGGGRLADLEVTGSTVSNLKALAGVTSLRSLTLSGDGYMGTNFQPLSALRNLSTLWVDSSPSKPVVFDRGVTAPAKLPRDLNGEYIVPDNKDVRAENGKMVKSFTFNKNTGQIRYNTANAYAYESMSSNDNSSNQPGLYGVYMSFSRTVEVGSYSQWAENSSKKLQITGTRSVGSALTVTHPYADHYQWLRSGKSIAGATKKTYKLSSSDLGHKIQVRGTDKTHPNVGSWKRVTPYSQTATATTKLLRGFSKAPAPKISGTPVPGKTLSAKVGTWSAKPTKLTLQWKRDGKAIKGATKTKYKVTNADKGKKLTVTVTASRSGYSATAKTSSTFAIPAKQKSTAQPTLTSKRDGNSFRFTTNHGKWAVPPTSYSYRWYVNGKAVKGATRKSYTPRWSGKKVSVKAKVTAKRPGYGSTARYSGTWTIS